VDPEDRVPVGDGGELGGCRAPVDREVWPRTRGDVEVAAQNGGPLARGDLLECRGPASAAVQRGTPVRGRRSRVIRGGGFTAVASGW